MKSKDAVESLAALAQESRLAIFRMLVKRGPEGYTPTQLGEKLNVSSPTLSFHLKELQRAGLVDVRRDAAAIGRRHLQIVFRCEGCKGVFKRNRSWPYVY